MVIGGWPQAQRAEDALDVLLDGVVGDEQALGDRVVRAPFGDQREHLALAIGQVLERVVGEAAAAHQLANDCRVEYRAPGRPG